MFLVKTSKPDSAKQLMLIIYNIQAKQVSKLRLS